MKINKTHSTAFHATLYIVLIIVLCLALLTFISLGSADISFSETYRIIANGIFSTDFPEDISKSHIYIIWQVRMPRVIISILVGMALSVAGAVFQAIFRNPMSDPFILGISSGAAFGVALGAVTGFIMFIPGIWGLPISAFAGAITATLIIYFLSGGMQTSTSSLLLSGIAMNFFLSSLMSMLLYFNRDRLENIIFWSMGSFSSANWDKCIIGFPIILIGIVCIFFFQRELDLLLIGDESARSMGLSLKRVRIILLIIATFVTAAAVSISGIIAFVGLIIPHIIRMVIGPKHRIMLPYVILVGGLFTLCADTLARSILPSSEIPVGIITSLTGAPFFIYLLRNKRREIL
ncbi:MAG: iron ABC transporter permease [Bacteroidetes bacterium]|nr:iron ABC transporter permease [Bacteroidota bacterium]